MLIPLKAKEVERIIPIVATSAQFTAALGDPRKILQRIIISSIGGVLTFLISQSLDRTQFGAIWLILAVIFLLYMLWGPILEASRINSKLRSYSFSAIFDGDVIDAFSEERVENSYEQANKIGQLELVENRRRWLILELGDEDGYLTNLEFPLDNKHQAIKVGSKIRCIVFSNKRDFSTIMDISDAWLPSNRLWVGKYPYMLKPAFEELCYLRLKK